MLSPGYGGGRPQQKKEEKAVTTVDDILNLDPNKPVPSSVEKALSHVLSIKMRQSELPNKTVMLETAGRQLLTVVTPIAVAVKDSQIVAPRTVRSRTKQFKEIMQIIFGSSSEALTTQASHVIKSFDTDSREAISKNLKQIIKISPEQMSATKSCLSLP